MGKERSNNVSLSQAWDALKGIKGVKPGSVKDQTLLDLLVLLEGCWQEKFMVASTS